MKPKENGFTLIELVAVILVLGIIAAISIPRFVNLSTAAREASVEAVAGSLASGSAINLSTYIIASTDAAVISPVPIESCSDAWLLLEQGKVGGYSLEASEGHSSTVADRETTTCDVVDSSDSTIRAAFVLYGVNPSAP